MTHNVNAGLEKVNIGKIRIVKFHDVELIFNMLLHHGAITISIETIFEFQSALYVLDLCPFSDDSDLQDIKRSFEMDNLGAKMYGISSEII